MHRNIFLGITAWLLGAATATAGCLLAVSLLGSGITASGSGQLLTQDAANRELASEAAKSEPAAASAPAASTGPGPALAPAASPPVPSSASASPAVAPGYPGTTDTNSGGGAAGDTAPSGSAPAGTVLASSAGDVVATCQAAGAYLVSWSPLQGYEADSVFRGPAATASVTFESRANEVTMTVSCPAGVPSATTSTGGGGDN